MILKRTFAAKQWVAFKKVRDRQPFIEADLAGAVRIVFENRHTRPAQAVEVPLAKMARRVTGLLHRGGQRLFLTAQRVAVIEHARAIMRAAGQHCGARGRAGTAATCAITTTSAAARSADAKGSILSSATVCQAGFALALLCPC